MMVIIHRLTTRDLHHDRGVMAAVVSSSWLSLEFTVTPTRDPYPPKLMYQLTLEWHAGSQLQQAILTWDPAALEIMQTLGRSADCTLTLLDPAKHISGLHAGIYFKAETQGFWLRNLTRDRISPQQPNPIWVDGVKVIDQETPLTPGSQIQLGKLILMVKTIGIPAQTPPAPVSSLSQVKCSRDSDPHLLPISYIGQNCPYCGQLVLSSTVISRASR